MPTVYDKQRKVKSPTGKPSKAKAWMKKAIDNPSGIKRRAKKKVAKRKPKNTAGVFQTAIANQKKKMRSIDSY